LKTPKVVDGRPVNRWTARGNGRRARRGAHAQAIRVLCESPEPQRRSRTRNHLLPAEIAARGRDADGVPGADHADHRTTLRRLQGEGRSDVAVAKLVQAELDKILKENSPVRITPVFTTVDHTLRTYHSAIGALIEGSILAVVGCGSFCGARARR